MACCRARLVSLGRGGVSEPALLWRQSGGASRRDKHRFGLFVMKGMPTKGMRDAAEAQEVIETEFGRFPAMQFVTLASCCPGILTLTSPRLPVMKRTGIGWSEQID